MKKEKLPAIHIYPGDWLKDEISGCTLEAQGMWLRLMFVMHESDRYGYLCIDGVPTPPEHLARRVGCSTDQFTTLFAELESAGVPSKTPEGVIYSRRMVRDAEVRRIRAEAGKKGGRPPSIKSKSKAKVKQNTENEDVVNSVVVVDRGVGKGAREIQLPEALEADRGPIKKWLAYLAENGKVISGPIALDAFFKKLLELGPGRAAAMEYSMSNGWLSIHQNKDAKKDEVPSYWTPLEQA